MDWEKTKFAVELVLTLLVTPMALMLWIQLRDTRRDGVSTAKALEAHKLHVSENFATKDDLTGAIAQFTRGQDQMGQTLARIEGRLDRALESKGTA
jgi:hypothetical protein